MAPIIVLIRHGQAYHNSTQNYDLHDPALTPLGHTQCAALRDALRKPPFAALMQDVGLIFVSPMQRTLETATIGLHDLIARGVPIQLSALWQENSGQPCDTGSEIEAMRQKWQHLDWSTVDPTYPAKTGKYAFTPAAIRARAAEAREALRGMEEKVVVVVSHAGFLGDGVSHKRFSNADFRVFGFADSEAAELVEYELTQQSKGGMGTSEEGTCYL